MTIFTSFGAVASITDSLGSNVRVGRWPLSEFTKTEQKGLDNTPDAASLANLQKLGAVGTDIYNQIGPFAIISAHRSPAVNASLAAGGNDQVSTTSLHMTGSAFDIQPSTMKVEAFFEKLLKSPLKNKLGEIAIKNNVLHLSLPTATKVGVPMYVNDAGQYIRLGLDEAIAYARKRSGVVSVSAVALVAATLALFLYLRSRKRAA